MVLRFLDEREEGDRGVEEGEKKKEREEASISAPVRRKKKGCWEGGLYLDFCF